MSQINIGLIIILLVFIYPVNISLHIKWANMSFYYSTISFSSSFAISWINIALWFICFICGHSCEFAEVCFYHNMALYGIKFILISGFHLKTFHEVSQIKNVTIQDDSKNTWLNFGDLFLGLSISNKRPDLLYWIKELTSFHRNFIS